MATSRKSDEASSSSEPSSSNPMIYDVFLSFRGEDTRNNFTGHLYQTLKDAGIKVFIDENELQRGEIINEELLRAIQGSKISVIIFSRRYADSSWCLEELVKIMECRTTLGQRVVPVFYDVDPSDVRKQSGTFGEAFDLKHGKKDEDIVKRWRAALNDSANLSGWDLKTKADGHEANFIRMLIQEISKFLNNSDLKVADNEIGIGSRMKDIVSLLDVGKRNDVRIVGIWGMGGIGKTTVAKALYNKFHQSFEASSFLADVRQTMQTKGMVSLQEGLLSDISKTSMSELGHVARGVNVIKNRLRCRRVFIVIDDVDHVEQLKELAIERDSFGLGSRVLVTTRDEHLLTQLDVDFTYQVQLMDDEEALNLFTLHAFKNQCPNEEYLTLSRRVVDCCGGLPLALKVLGSFLVGRSTRFWECAIKQMQALPFQEIQERLKISYDDLEYNQKEMFLDISCFFIGQDLDHVKEILDSFDFSPETGIEVLIQRCLVTVNATNKLMMHDLLRDMGRSIVRAKCPENPRKWSRVWHIEDTDEVLRNESECDEIQGLTVNGTKISKTISTKAFAKMKRLRFLKLRNLEITGGYKYLPNKLECLDWLDFPLKSIPRDFNLGEAVAIYLRRSQLRYVWNDSRVLAKLKILDLSDSYFLKQSPEFSTIPNLEKLVFRHCHNLSEVHHSIGALGRLSTVDLAQCSSLKELPTSFYKLKSVVTLVLDRCVRFEKLDEEIGDMTSLSTLRVNETAITELPSSMVRLKNLRCVSLRPRSDMVRFENRECLCRTKSYSREYRSTRRLLLPPSVQGLSSLDTLRISDRDLTYVPKDLGSLASLKNLDLQFCTLQSLPSLSGLNRLVDLNLTGCNLTDEIIKIMDLGSLFSLKLLDLSRNSFTSLPSLCSLSKLKTLDLNYCENLVAIPKLPASLMMLEAKKCTALVIMPDFSSVCNMRRIRLLGCYKVVDVPGLDRSLKNTMRLLNMAGCNNITATLKEKILRGWNFVGSGGIFLPPSDIPEWFNWVNEGGRVHFQVPEIRGSNVIAITLCLNCFKKCSAVFITNHSKLTTFCITQPMGLVFKEFLWLGHIPNYEFNLEGGDLVEVIIEPGMMVRKSGVSLVWDTEQPDFRVDTDWVDRAFNFRQYRMYTSDEQMRTNLPQ